MRSLVLPAPARGWLWSALGALAMVFGVVTASPAELLSSTIFPADLGIVITVVPPLPPIGLPLGAPVAPTRERRDGSGQLTKVGFPASVFQTTGLTVMVSGTAPTIGGLQMTIKNAPGNFTRVGGKFHGVMPLLGNTRVCAFGSCPSAALNITVPLSIVGGAGVPPDATKFVGTGTGGKPNAPILVTVKGAPWTQGAVTLTTPDAGTVMASGNFAAQTQTTMGATYMNVVELVTPIFISTSVSLSSVVPAFGSFKFTLNSPEPGTVAALGAAIISLVAMGVVRRR